MLFLGIDIGTTNTKAVLVDPEQRLVDRICIPSAQVTKRGELDAQTWKDHFVLAIRHFKTNGSIGRNPLVCGITAQGGSFVLLNKHFKAVSPGFSWTRIAEDSFVSDLKQTIDEDRFYRMTGWAPSGWLTAVKLKKIRQTQPDVLRDMRYVATVPDFIFSQFQGKLITDITSAQITGLFDINTGDWSPEILGWAQIRPESAARVISTLQTIGDPVRVEGQEVLFVTSTHDQYAAMHAVGVKEGTLMLATGTAWVINGKSDRPLYDEHRLIHPGRDLTVGTYGYIAALGVIGKGFDLLLKRHGIGYGDLLPDMREELDRVPPPQRPFVIDIAEGSIRGETMATAEAIHRYMEVAGARVRYVLEKMGVRPGLKKLLMTGGAVTGGVWPRIIASICHVPVEAVSFDELNAFGAAGLARLAVLGDDGRSGWPEEAQGGIYEPQVTSDYEEWFWNHQYAVFEREPWV